MRASGSDRSNNRAKGVRSVYISPSGGIKEALIAIRRVSEWEAGRGAAKEN